MCQGQHGIGYTGHEMCLECWEVYLWCHIHKCQVDGSFCVCVKSGSHDKDWHSWSRLPEYKAHWKKLGIEKFTGSEMEFGQLKELGWEHMGENVWRNPISTNRLDKYLLTQVALYKARKNILPARKICGQPSLRDLSRICGSEMRYLPLNNLYFCPNCLSLEHVDQAIGIPK